MSSECAYVFMVAPSASAATAMSNGTMAAAVPHNSTVAAAASAISCASMCTWANFRSYFCRPATITLPKPLKAGTTSTGLPWMMLSARSF